jgi:hypothetical protein
MHNQVQDMLVKGVIVESVSPWSSPAILVPNKSLDGKPKYRVCVDFRALNAVTQFRYVFSFTFRRNSISITWEQELYSERLLFRLLADKDRRGRQN